METTTTQAPNDTAVVNRAVLARTSAPPKGWPTAFIRAFERCGNVTHAAKLAKVSRRAVVKRVKRDPAFAQRFHHAKQVAADQLERAAWKRAVNGMRKPVYQGGKRVGFVREYSDPLLKLLLQANRPKKYRDRQLIEHRIAEPAVASERQRRLLADPQAAALAAELDARLAAPQLPGPESRARMAEGGTESRPADQVSDS